MYEEETLHGTLRLHVIVTSEWLSTRCHRYLFMKFEPFFITLFTLQQNNNCGWHKRKMCFTTTKKCFKPVCNLDGRMRNFDVQYICKR